MTAANFFSSLKAFFVGLFLLFCASHLFFHASSSIVAGFSTHLPITSSIPVLKLKTVYVSRVFLGVQKVQAFVVVSTGSNFNWVLCDPCDCYEHNGNKFFPVRSQSYGKLACINNQHCSLLPENKCDGDNKCMYTFKYQDDSNVSGILSTDRLRFLSPEETPVLDNFIFGCTNKTHRSFSKDVIGMIGLGRSPLSLTSQLENKIFSYCLPRATAQGWLNFGPANHAASSTTIELVDVESNLYYVMLMSIVVHKADHPVIIISPQGRKLMIDTGTSLTYIDNESMKNLIDFLTQHTPYPLVESPLYELCFDIGEDRKDPRLPSISFFFKGSAEVYLSPQNIFLRVGETTMCLSIVSNVRIGGERNIFGSQAQMGRDIMVDLQINKINLGEFGKC